MFRKLLRRAALAVLVLALWFVGRPAWHLGLTWWHDGNQELPPTSPGRTDASRLLEVVPEEVIAVANDPLTAEAQLAALVRRAASAGHKIVVSGARHSMGAHTMREGALVVDMLPFRHMSLDAGRRILTVGAGARWLDVIPLLDRAGLAVSVMQSNNDFTVGGSISVNCHGWQHARPPIASTVEAIRLLLAEGRIVRCTRTENRELFAAALGGYGLIGIILEADLRVVPNEFYRAQQFRTSPANYVDRYRELHTEPDTIGMAYGRISVAPEHFLEEAIIVLLQRSPDAPARSVQRTLTDEKPSALKRLVFRGSVGSDYGKSLRWRLEKFFGETGDDLRSRNQIMNEPAAWFANRDPESTEILQEFFVPPARFNDFVSALRPILLRHRPDLLNITVRHVSPDPDTTLAYAREEVLGLVMLFHQARTREADLTMRDLTRELIDAALACGGTYYLPYRPHATFEQFRRAYPQADEFFAVKRRHDPGEIFQNTFFLNYGPSAPRAQRSE